MQFASHLLMFLGPLVSQKARPESENITEIGQDRLHPPAFTPEEATGDSLDVAVVDITGAQQCSACKDSHHHMQPLLGYDWIAGVLDAEDSLIERSDEFFNDLCTFRSLNKDECVHSLQAEFAEENQSALPLQTDKNVPEAKTDTHHCTFSYRINSRLFPVPLHSQECCPVCRKHKSSHPHTVAEPALIRVSIPRSALLPSYKYKAHRRSSFDPSDSLGLPSHCLSGWSNKGQSSLPPPSSLDLRSSLNTKNKELEVCSQPYQPDSEGNCRNTTTEYLLENFNLCCKKCPPGKANSNVKCQECPDGTFSDRKSSTDRCQPHTV
ncbi:Migration and invasion-inhibitory protein IGFBP2-binding protein [Collichthys lucidus]|uniref:Migration and invasion-inhibitory protein IGFBP2-binding protein n=1 Tax=Collichthys lucidus TaxID=240159 RepID=A0A4U5UA00_COLLU|nr:Migration and invasion-inhibitory protein IGFBP2-binding protein [Collichthys lucidus]